MIGRLLCRLGFHKYRIMKLVDRRGRTVSFSRTCDRKDCKVAQTLEHTEHYTAGAYVWTDRKLKAR